VIVWRTGSGKGWRGGGGNLLAEDVLNLGEHAVHSLLAGGRAYLLLWRALVGAERCSPC
jgi:hypothetical protein